MINRDDQESTNSYLQRLITQMGKQNSWDCLVPATKNYLFWKGNKPEKGKQKDAPMFLPFPHLLSDVEHLQTYGKVDEGF